MMLAVLICHEIKVPQLPEMKDSGIYFLYIDIHGKKKYKMHNPTNSYQLAILPFISMSTASFNEPARVTFPVFTK